MTDTIIAIIVVALAATMCGFSLYRVLTGKAKSGCGGCGCSKLAEKGCDVESCNGKQHISSH